jgi:hypothetical protein
LITEVGRIGRLQMALFLCNEGPCFVQLDSADVQAAHCCVVQDGTTIADAHAKAQNRAPVDASKSLGCADADAFAECGDRLNLLMSGENVHGGIPCGRGSRHKARLDDWRPNRYIEVAG